MPGRRSRANRAAEGARIYNYYWGCSWPICPRLLLFEAAKTIADYGHALDSSLAPTVGSLGSTGRPHGHRRGAHRPPSIISDDMLRLTAVAELMNLAVRAPTDWVERYYLGSKPQKAR